ncbi:uncharacterized protein LOC111041190 [Myzus persicae]|uniref:uncharacterized protein LOC111041190 n=1 Tax=Myzus persicae TaxID=13164 RepID=UPI000B935220|nr:uncharacterized protein LOC111041190 [Myzus persicae]
MASSRDSITGTSKFTTHAAAILRSEFPYPGDAHRPLLNVSQECYEQIKHVIQKTYPKCDIFKIQHVNAPEMYGMYLLRKEEMRLSNGGNDVKERILFHVTSEDNAIDSLIHGLNGRRNQFLRFGTGVSFSNSAAYSNYYAEQSTNKVGVRVIILSYVLMNAMLWVNEKEFSRMDMTIPPCMADTIVSGNESFYVKYNDFESYPFFFVYYLWSPKLLNECKYFNDVVKTLRAEEKALCKEMAYVRLNPESKDRHEISLLRNASKQRHAVEKAEAEAEGAALLKTPNKNTRKRRLAVGKTEAETEAGALQKFQNKNSKKRSLAVDKAESNAKGASLKCPKKNTRKRRQPMLEPKSSKRQKRNRKK